VSSDAGLIAVAYGTAAWLLSRSSLAADVTSNTAPAARTFEPAFA
jgi:hypothetical protein